MRTIYSKLNLKKILGAIALPSMLLFSGCSLDEKTYDFYGADDYFSNTNRLKMAVNGVYSTFSSLDTYGQYWMIYDLDTDISHVQAESLGHTARDLGHYNISSTHAWLQESWTKYYVGVDRANLILERRNSVPLKPVDTDTILFNNLVAQTKALRAMCYFDLVRLFGDVPLVTKSVTVGDNYFLAKTARDSIYDNLIIPGLTEAIKDLPWVQDGEQISKSAAMGLLARVHLFRGGYSLYGSGSKGEMKRSDDYKEHYQKAKVLLDQVIAENKHGLLDSYEKVFKNMCELVYDRKENMLEIPFFTQAGEKLGSSVMGSYNGPSINIDSKYGRANSFVKTHSLFYDWFDADSKDLRRDVSIATYQINAQDEFKQIAKMQSYNWAPGKWRRNWQTGQIKDNNNTDVNVVLLRYSDVLLMRAEVENELNNGPTPLAIEAINQVHRRAFGKPYLAADASDFSISDFNGKEDFFNYLFKERARELAFEGHRRMDLVRWNLLDQAIKTTDAGFKKAQANGEMRKYTFKAGELFKHGVHELYPIPDYDIRESGGLLIQNPGY